MNIHADEWNSSRRYISLEHRGHLKNLWNYRNSSAILKTMALSRTGQLILLGGFSLPREGIVLTATPGILLALLRMGKFMLIVARDWMSLCAHIRKKNKYRKYCICLPCTSKKTA